MSIVNPVQTRADLEKALEVIRPLKENARTASDTKFFEDLEIGIMTLISGIDSDAIQSYADAINTLKAGLDNSAKRLNKVQKETKKLADNLKLVSQAIEAVGKLAKDATS